MDKNEISEICNDNLLFKRVLDSFVNQPNIAKDNPIKIGEKKLNAQPINFEQLKSCKYIYNNYSIATIHDYSHLNINQKLNLELQSIGLGCNNYLTPNNFINFLKNLIGKNINDITHNMSEYIIQESIKFGIPYTCKDSKLNRDGFQKSYITFFCKFHTKKRTGCQSKFKIIIENKIVKDINFIEIKHNHSLDRIYIESKISLITNEDKKILREAVHKGLSTPSLRKLTNINLLPQQMYNVIRNEKKEYFSNEILNLQNYVKNIQNKFDVFWKFDNDNKFYNLIIINSIIKNCYYANDIVVIDDTMCTNNFDYPFFVFLVFDENNMAQILAISIISGKNEKSFEDILSSLKTFIPTIRIFIMDRLKSQTNAVKKVYPLSKIVYCRIHIERNIIKNIKIADSKEILNIFKNFIDEKLDRMEYIKRLSSLIHDNKKSSKHIKKLIDDVDCYDPKILKSYNLKGHFTTNSIEGTFGNIKKQTEHKITPLHAILKAFVNYSENLIKRNINFKHTDINDKIYQYQDLGEYAIKILNERYKRCIEIVLMLNNENMVIQNKAHDIIDKCNCIEDVFLAFTNCSNELNQFQMVSH